VVLAFSVNVISGTDDRKGWLAQTNRKLITDFYCQLKSKIKSILLSKISENCKKELNLFRTIPAKVLYRFAACLDEMLFDISRYCRATLS